MRVPEGTPDYPGFHNMWSADWVRDEYSKPAPPVLGDVTPRRRTYDKGIAPIPYPSSITIGSAECIARGEDYPPSTVGRTIINGFDSRCYVVVPPLPPVLNSYLNQSEQPDNLVITGGVMIGYPRQSEQPGNMVVIPITQNSYLSQSEQVTSVMTPEPQGYSLLFDGSTGYVDLGNGSSLQIIASNISVVAWVKSSAPGSAYRDILTKNSNYGIGAYNDSTFYSYDWFGTGRHDSSVNPWDGSWHHVAVVLQPTVIGGCQIYVDGVASGSPFSQAYNTSVFYNLCMGNTFLGGPNNPYTEWFAGKIYLPAVFPSALTSAQIAALAAMSITPESLSPAGCWPMTEGSGTSLGDDSGNSNTGTLYGGATWSNDVP